ncbi:MULTISPECIES: restriction endonuclease subunit S [unclassified Streptomyces]|uniref:restriction endonuclease subunit S n=1 Tax=unclassified Streptomyces TaxID=2593676 RepID=UPI000CF2EA0D|nr:restriction endonuclease subunit S [Streptomyces sp. QL37]PPQ59485.1 hypothetical protein C5F59_24565 [Streptomyces sp. QL37]
MSLNLDKVTWKRVRLGDVIRRSRTQVAPANGDVDRYVGGGHIDSDSLTIERFGDVNDGQMGSTFTYLFQPGQVLFVSARPYLRKSGVVNFSGVVADKTYVLDAIPENGLLQEFLPFVLASEHFIAFATAEASGSMNPRLLWGQIQRYEFDLPPLDEQQRLADLLWALERHGQGLASTEAALRSTRQILVRDRLARVAELGGVARLDSLIESGRPITYGILMPGSGVENGIPVIKVKDFPDGRIREGQLLLTTEELAQEYRRSTLKQGDLVISIRGTIGRLAEVPASLVGANITQDSARLSIDPKHDRRYVRLALESEYCQEQIRRKTTGTRVLGLNLGALRELDVPVPSDRSDAVDVIREAESLTKAIDETAIARRHLTTLRAVISAEVLGGAG